MQLFERVKYVAKKFYGSETKLAEALGIGQSKINRCMNAKAEHNLWDYLPRILELHSQLSKAWLYMGEGEMFGGGDSQKPPTPHIDAALLQQVIEMLEEHLQAVKGKLSPAAKATVVSQLYELLVEQETQAREPIQMMRLVMGALAKVANE